MRVLLRILIVAAVLLAIVTVEMTSRSGVLWRMTTFTYQANILAAAFYLWTLVFPRADARGAVRGAVVLYLVVAGVLWNLFLTGYSMGYSPANILLHIVVPALAVTDWLVIARGQSQVSWWQPLVWLIYPAVYLGLALLVLNRAGRRAPYYFLDPQSVGTAGVIANAVLLALLVLGLGYLLLVVSRPRRRPPVSV